MIFSIHKSQNWAYIKGNNVEGDISLKNIEYDTDQRKIIIDLSSNLVNKHLDNYDDLMRFIECKFENFDYLQIRKESIVKYFESRLEKTNMLAFISDKSKESFVEFNIIATCSNGFLLLTKDK
jgi:hypothetical protein